MDNRQEQILVNGGECYLHYHPDDRIPTHDTLQRLQSLQEVLIKSASYTLGWGDDWIAVDTTSTMTLPAPRANKEFVIANIGAAATVTIAAPTGCTINGASSIALATQWTGKHIKPLSNTAYLAI